MKLDSLARDDNAALKALILDSIRRQGSISFAEYMDLALYHPEHGYYVNCDPTLDYQSSPDVHPVFGACIARQLIALWQDLDRPPRFDVFECGAGNGRLAADIFAYAREAAPEFFAALHYVLQDRSQQGPGLPAKRGLPLEKARVAAELPAAPEIEGCILSNELLDALPCHRVRRRENRFYELRVGEQDGRLLDIEAEAPPNIDAYFEALNLLPGDGCDAEVNLQAPEWLRRAAGALKHGFVLTLDYGYEAADLYAPWRKRGTLLTFYRHTSDDDPYVRIGRQDITASVDFTTLQRAGEDAGLRTVELTTQAQLLARLGLGEALARRPEPGSLETYYALRRAVLELTDAAGLGRIRVLLQAKATQAAP